MEPTYETLLGLVAGIGLAAACGFRLFIPLLVTSIAIRADMLSVAEGFEWIGSTPALIGFGCATALEIGAYYIPFIDNLLDTVATPAAVVAGTVLSAAVFVDMDPWLQWSLAAVAGGGMAAAVQGGTVVVRGTSSATTAGLGNPVVASGELAGSAAFAAASIVTPVLVLVLFLAAGTWFFTRWRRRRLEPA
jgi:hypothetical protein